VYLTFDQAGGLGTTSGNLPVANLPAGSVAIGVVIEPLLAWLWAGGLLVGLGGVLALVPGSRRRATDPVSAPSTMVTGTGRHLEPGPEDTVTDKANGRESALEPVGSGVPAQNGVPVESGAPSA